jgi:hypothetical protein
MNVLSVVDPKQAGPKLDDRLRAQNEGASWRDCVAAGLGHLWVRSHETEDATYWRCRRCPVDTRTLQGRVPGGAVPRPMAA